MFVVGRVDNQNYLDGNKKKMDCKKPLCMSSFGRNDSFLYIKKRALDHSEKSSDRYMDWWSYELSWLINYSLE